MKVFVVAEVGVNWDGNLHLAKQMIQQAHIAGADAVKFQAFLREHVEGHPEAEKILESSVTMDNVGTFRSIADANSIEFFCTPFYPDAVDFLYKAGVRRFKIRERDSREMLEDPTLISPIMKRILDVDWRNEIFVSCQTPPLVNKWFWNSNVHTLYCVPQYPPRLEEIDFSTIRAFHGYSNHYPSIEVPLLAASRLNPAIGPKIIEVHVTANHDMKVPDAAVSFDFVELQTLVKYLRTLEYLETEHDV